MSPYLIFGATMLVLIFNTIYWQVMRPARKRYQAAVAATGPAPAPGLEQKIPRDTSRTYPRPGRTRSKLTRICPVCGMEDPGNLDGQVLGWPAHRSCAEWLGDWRPQRQYPVLSAQDLAKTREALEAASSSHKVIVLPPGGVSINVKDSPGAQINVGGCDVAMLTNGFASVDEMRERIIGAFSVPSSFGAAWSAAGDRQPFVAAGDGLYHSLSAMAFGNHRPLSVVEQRQKPPGVPLLFCDCPCGRKYIGTNEWLNRELALHRGSGECPPYR